MDRRTESRIIYGKAGGFSVLVFGCVAADQQEDRLGSSCRREVVTITISNNLW